MAYSISCIVVILSTNTYWVSLVLTVLSSIFFWSSLADGVKTSVVFVKCPFLGFNPEFYSVIGVRANEFLPSDSDSLWTENYCVMCRGKKQTILIAKIISWVKTQALYKMRDLKFCRFECSSQ